MLFLKNKIHPILVARRILQQHSEISVEDALDIALQTLHVHDITSNPVCMSLLASKDPRRLVVGKEIRGMLPHCDKLESAIRAKFPSIQPFALACIFQSYSELLQDVCDSNTTSTITHVPRKTEESIHEGKKPLFLFQKYLPRA